MASSTDKDASCANDPNFAIICGFFEKFSEVLQIKHPNFQQLQEWIGNTDEVPNGLRDLHIKLLRKTRKTVHESAWETALSKFCYTYSHQDAWEIERFGYKKSSLKVKLKILRELVEAQFERNANFRSKIMSFSADALRFKPIGRDRLGHSYWVTQDNDTNLRVYQEHLDEEIWQVVATSREEFVTLINRLKGNEVVLPSEIGAIDEDSSSNSCQAALDKPPPPEERDDSQDDDSNKIATKIPNIKIKLGTQENGLLENRIEKISCTKVLQLPQISNGSQGKVDFENKKLMYNEKEEETDIDEEDKNSKSKTEDTLNRKVKPLFIKHSKMSKINEDKPKKRMLDAQEKKLTEELTGLKKYRPTLLDTKREIKISRYENPNDESDEEGEDDEEEEGEEEVEDEEDEDEAEEDEEELDFESELENEEEKDLFKKHIDINNIVSEPIEEEVLLIKGEGMGKECEGQFCEEFFSRELLNYCYNERENDVFVSEAIEGDLFVVCGEGLGADCLVGNTKDETEPKATFFFGQPGCLKLSPVKKSPTLGSSAIDTIKESVVFNKSNADDITIKNGDGIEKSKSDLEDCQEELQKKNEIPEVCLSNAINILKNEIEIQNDIKASVESLLSIPPSPNLLRKTEQLALLQSRKRCLNEKICEISKSETDGNIEKYEHNDEVGGKRQKMRCKIPNTIVRKKIEAKRLKTKEETSSSEEETLSQQKNIKTSHIKTNVLNKNQSIDEIAKKTEKEDNTTMSKQSVLASDSEKNLDSQNKNKVFSKGILNANQLITDKLYPNTELRLIENVETCSITDFGESNGDLCEKQNISIQLKDPISESNLTKILELPIEVNSKDSSQKLSSEQELKNKREPCVAFILAGSMPANDVKGQGVEDIDNKLEVKKIIPDMGNISKIETKSYGEKYKHDISKEESLYIPKGQLEKKCIIDLSARSTRSGRRSCAEVPVELTLKKRTRMKAEHKRTDLSAAVKCKKSDTEDLNEEKIIISTENIKVELKFEEQAENVIESTDILSVTCLPTLVTPKKTGIGSRKKQEVDTKNIIDADSETPVRQSRRIAQLKIREEADRRKLEEVALKKMKDELKKKKKAQLKEIVDDPTVSEPTQSEKDENSEEEEEIKKKIEKQKKKGQKKNGWSSGSEDPEEEEEVEEHYFESDPGSPLFKSDHEFSPESDVEDESQMVPMKRARTARQEGEDTLIDEGTDEACIKCGKKDHPEWILLCDKCDKGYHCSCLSPVLFYIPEGDWFCPPCQQEQLIGALELHLIKYDELVIRRKQEEQDRIHTLKLQEEQKQREIEEELIEQERENHSARKHKTESCRSRNRNYRKGSKKKLYRGHRQNRKRKSSVYDKENSDESDTDSRENSNKSNGTASSYSSKSSKSNTSSSSSNSLTDSDDEPIYKLRKRRQINVSYRLHEYDDLLKSALKEEDDDITGAGNLGRGKDISNIVDAESDASEKVENNILPKVLSNEIEPKRSGKHIDSDSGSSYGEENLKRKPKMSKRSTKKKKSRKLNALDVSSEGDNDSDEDFKTSSFDDDEEEDESISISTNSDSSLEMFRRRNKGKKKTRRAARHSARERRKVKKFVVEDSDESDLDLLKLKKKKKVDSDYSESETNDDDEDNSDEIDSEALCDDSTDSDSAWRPGKRNKQPTSLPAKKEPRPKPKVFVKQKKEKREDENDRSFKHSVVKKKNTILDDEEEDDENDTSDSGRRTRGKRFTYLEDYEEDSSDGGIKPGVKRPDTPPEEREQFIKKQEEIKRMLAEKNTEAAKVAATPTLTPIKAGAKFNKGTPEKLDSLSTVPLSVIRQAKALDVDYLQRKGESVSDVDGETDFDDDDLPDDFNPEDMDEEAIVRIMEEEDFSNQPPKLVGDSVMKQKKLKESESAPPKQFLQIVPSAPSLQQKQKSLLQEPLRKRLPMPTLHPPLLRNPGHSSKFSHQHLVDHQQHQQQPYLPLLQNALTTPLGHALSKNISQAKTIPPTKAIEESNKPRGRRKKITPLRDPLEKQKAAEAVTAAAVTVTPSTDTILSTTPLKTKTISQSIPVQHSKAACLSVAQPPQLYKPPSQVNTHPSVITRMSHLPARPTPQGAFSEQRTRIYPPNHLIGHRPQLRQGGLVLGPMPLHHNLRPSYAAGPPPLRQVGDPRHTTPQRQQQYRLPADQYPPPRPRLGTPLINQYRPTIYGNPQLYSPGSVPLQPNQQGNSLRPIGPSDYLPASQYCSGPYGYYPSPPPLSVQQQHTNNQSTTQSSSGVPSSVIVAAPSVSANLRHPPPANPTNKITLSSASPSVVMALPSNASRISNITEPRKKLMTLETFNSKLTPPLTDTSSRSPYSSNATVENDQAEDDSPPSPQSALATESTSEFSGLVSYFSSQQDDFNT